MKSKKTICFVATVDFAINAFLLNHIRVLSKNFNIFVIVNTPDENFLSKQGIKAKVIPLAISRNINLIYDFFSLFRLIYIFLRLRPCAVHSITPKAGLLAMMAAFCCAVPLKVHTFTGQVWVQRHGIFRFFLKKIDMAIAFLADLLIVDSKSQLDFLVNEKIFSEKKATVFGSGSVAGVCLEKFKPNKFTFAMVRRELLIPKNAFVFIYLGRLNKDKGVLDLLKAFAQIKNSKAYLLVVGPDESNYSEKIKSLSGENFKRLRLVGFTSQPYRYLAASNAICLPSHREGFGSVIIEAAAMGVPSIASNIYGISDAVQHKKTGFLHPVKEPLEILRAMNFFLSNPKLVKHYGSEAKKRAIKEFNSQLLSKYWLAFYLKHTGE